MPQHITKKYSMKKINNKSLSLHKLTVRNLSDGRAMKGGAFTIFNLCGVEPRHTEKQSCNYTSCCVFPSESFCTY
jgi:hypothetical protein